MKIALIKERKSPPDRRVVFSPEEAKNVKEQFSKADIIAESSDIRVFSDEQYENLSK